MALVGQLRKALYALRGSQRYTRFAELQKMQYLPLEELRARQFMALKKMIEHAYTTTVYYKKMFDSLGITPNDINSFEDYAKLPLLTKPLIQENLEDLCSSTIPQEQRILNASGGTTGNPASFYQSEHVFTEMDAHWLFMLSMAGWTEDDMIVSIWGNPKELLSNAMPKYIKPWLSGMVTLNAYSYNEQTLHMWTKVFKRYKRVIVYGYATVIADFARYCIDNGIADLPIFAAMTTAEKLSPLQRECIEKAFSCKVFDQYGAREMPGVASQCEHGNMHIHTTAAYAEFIPLEDASENSIENNRIVLTSLNNFAMPMLRYEIGDLGSAQEGQCSCGRGYPLMHMEVGRIGAYLLLPEGGKLYSTMFVRQMYNIDGVNSFQFRQTALRHVDLYIIRGKNFTSESHEKLLALVQKFPQSVCPGAELELHYVDTLPRTQGGKHRQVICEVNNS